MTESKRLIEYVTKRHEIKLNALQDAAAYAPAEIKLKIEKTIKTVMTEGK